MKRLFLSFLLLAVVCAADAQELTIQSIYGPNGLTGRVPDTVKWSPDGKKVSYFLHQEQGEKADLYYIDVTSGMQMLNAFITAGKQVDLQLYPRKTHSISGPGTRVHLFTRIGSHFHRVLLGTE